MVLRVNTGIFYTAWFFTVKTQYFCILGFQLLRCYPHSRTDDWIKDSNLLFALSAFSCSPWCVGFVCLLLQSMMCWVWPLEEGQEPDNSTFMCASGSGSEEICVGLSRAGHWADVTGRSDRSRQCCLCSVTDGGRDVVTLSRSLCVQNTQASSSVDCYDSLSTCITLGSAGCVGSIMELQLFLDTKRLLS